MQTGKTIKVVSVFDAAIDRASTGKKRLDEYATTRNYDLLAFKPDRLPKVFHVRRIPVHTLTRWVEVCETLGMQRERAFMAGVERIDNLYTPAGQLMPPRAPGKRMEHATGDTYFWSEEDIEALIDEELVDRPTLVEIGGVALTRAGLRLGNAAPYQLPLSLADEWAELLFRLADTRESKSAPQSSGEPVGEPTR